MRGRIRLLVDRLVRKLGLDDASLAKEHDRLVRSLADLEARHAARLTEIAQLRAEAARVAPHGLERLEQEIVRERRLIGRLRRLLA